MLRKMKVPKLSTLISKSEHVPSMKKLSILISKSEHGSKKKNSKHLTSFGIGSQSDHRDNPRRAHNDMWALMDWDLEFSSSLKAGESEEYHNNMAKKNYNDNDDDSLGSDAKSFNHDDDDNDNDVNIINPNQHEILLDANLVFDGQGIQFDLTHIISQKT
jgi:hypothetical protein